MGRSGRSLLLVLLTGTMVRSAAADPPTAPSPLLLVSGSESNGAASLPTEADLKVDVLQPGASTRAIREQAKKVLPIAQLTADQQTLAN
jgi:hypothetical protein